MNKIIIDVVLNPDGTLVALLDDFSATIIKKYSKGEILNRNWIYTLVGMTVEEAKGVA